MSAEKISQVEHERKILWENIPLTTPWVIYVEPSGYCNLKCRFCPQGSDDASQLIKDMMTMSLFDKMLGDLKKFSKKIELLRICGNGEPLMNKNIVLMMQHAKETNLFKKIEILSNGILLNDATTQALPNFLSRMIISIEGICSEDYKRICNTSINFEKLRSNIRNFYLNRNECQLHIKIHHEAVKTEERKKMFFNLFSDMCDEIYIENLVPMWPQLNGSYSTDEFRWGGGAVRQRRVCVQIFKGVQIQANGEVVPCCVDWKRVNIIGDIKHESLHEIWHSGRLKDFQLGHIRGLKAKMEPCKDCTMNDYCDIDDIDEFTQEIVQRLV